MLIPHICRPSHRSTFYFGFVFLLLFLMSSPLAVRSQTARPDVEAKLVSMPEAVYPDIAKEAWIAGNVNVRVKVD